MFPFEPLDLSRWKSAPYTKTKPSSDYVVVHEKERRYSEKYSSCRAYYDVYMQNIKTGERVIWDKEVVLQESWGSRVAGIFIDADVFPP